MKTMTTQTENKSMDRSKISLSDIKKYHAKLVDKYSQSHSDRNLFKNTLSVDLKNLIEKAITTQDRIQKGKWIFIVVTIFGSLVLLTPLAMTPMIVHNYDGLSYIEKYISALSSLDKLLASLAIYIFLLWYWRKRMHVKNVMNDLLECKTFVIRSDAHILNKDFVSPLENKDPKYMPQYIGLQIKCNALVPLIAQTYVDALQSAHMHDHRVDEAAHAIAMFVMSSRTNSIVCQQNLVEQARKIGLQASK